MPELPEVQTIVNDLQILTGDQFTGFWSCWEKRLCSNGQPISAENLAMQLKNKKLLAIERLGKYLYFNLSSSSALLIHLRMTGQLLLNDQFSIFNFQKNPQQVLKINKHTRHAFNLKSGRLLLFVDVRKFGTIEYFTKISVEEILHLKKITLDPLSPEFIAKHLQEIVARHPKAPIKDLLLRQDLIAGIGNIYASEILFAAQVLPQRSAGQLSFSELKEIVRHSKLILQKAIRLRGTSSSDYRDAHGQKGGFQKILRTYQRQGQNCLRCGTIIKRSVIGQRSTFFCPNCQK